MKLTKRNLKELIQEEVDNFIQEGGENSADDIMKLNKVNDLVHALAGSRTISMSTRSELIEAGGILFRLFNELDPPEHPEDRMQKILD